MIPLKELLGIAISHLHTFTTVKKPDFRLEHASYKADQKVWNLVVSWLVEQYDEGVAALKWNKGKYFRMWKRIHINEENMVVGMWFFEEEENRPPAIQQTGSAHTSKNLVTDPY